jgi:hypothetical protein
MKRVKTYSSASLNESTLNNLIEKKTIQAKKDDKKAKVLIHETSTEE